MNYRNRELECFLKLLLILYCRRGKPSEKVLWGNILTFVCDNCVSRETTSNSLINITQFPVCSKIISSRCLFIFVWQLYPVCATDISMSHEHEVRLLLFIKGNRKLYARFTYFQTSTWLDWIACHQKFHALVYLK